jgi:hypothetical protein
MLLGVLLLISLDVITLCIALGKVEQATSYGLNIILGCFTTLSGGFAVWAFTRPPDPPNT